jgi:hypothetical protein
MSVLKTNQIILYREIIVVHFAKYTEYTVIEELLNVAADSTHIYR